MFLRRHLVALAGLAIVTAPTLGAQQYDSSMFREMRWRLIGPYRGGRTVGATGVPGQPNVFYIGVNDGGVWRTTDYGRTWVPIFDDQPTGSIGAVAVAPSDPNTLYVGSGEGLHRPDLSTGDGVYKSTDAGKTWTRLGLTDAQQIGAIVIDPHDPNRVFVAALGHPYGPNTERGVYRSTNGGRSWERVLYKDENTGAIALALDPSNPQVVYADLWAGRQAPWENGAFQGPNSGLYKSTDGGAKWRQLTKGLPNAAQGLGRIGLSIAPSDSRRMYAMVDAGPLTGVYRSDDAGESWRRVNREHRVSGRGDDFAEVKVDPKNPDIIYVANTSTYKSIDGGTTFTAWKGAPGGDDYHTVWIDPNNPQVILLAVDQGATLTVNGGQTWSSWYNQPTAQLYHVATDHRFPYWVYGGQQESGSVGIASRSDDGEIAFFSWHPVGVEEYGYVAPDPLDTNIVYGGKATRYNWSTHQTQDVSPDPLRGKYKFIRTMPLLFSDVDPHVLYLAGNVLFKTTNGGKSWDVISPDLTRTTDSTVPANVGVYHSDPQAIKHHAGAIYAVAPSHTTLNTIWVGTDDGLIHVTRDGGAHWTNITPKELTPWAKVAQLDASHFDDNTVYAAINTFRLDDLRPHIFRTHDSGKTWSQITNGIPANEGIVNTVREDPVRKGLLYAGTERQVYVSFDDGDHWQPLRLNMPASSIRDLVIHDDDIVVGTHGRSFWILDDVTPLRQLNSAAASADAVLFAPEIAYRMRHDTWTDTPLPPEEPAGQNPPDGAIIDYTLHAAPKGPVMLEILDAQGRLVRQYASDDKPEELNPRDYDVPMYWARIPAVLPGTPGMHRWVWDERYPKVDALRRDFPISALLHDTPLEPRGPIALPGQYTVRLTVDGKSYTQPLTLKMDPRVKASVSDLQQQFDMATAIADAMHRDVEAVHQIQAVRTQVRDLRGRAPAGPLANAIAELDRGAAALGGNTDPSAGDEEPPPGAATGARPLSALNGQLSTLFTLVEGADAAPTTHVTAAWTTLQSTLADDLKGWSDLQATAIPTLNKQLKDANLSAVELR